MKKICLEQKGHLPPSRANLSPWALDALSIEQKFLFDISEKPRAQWKVHSSCRDQTKATASLVIVLVSRIQIIGPGENKFVKWKETFRSDRLDQIRIVSVKCSLSRGETIRACAKAGWVHVFLFFFLGWEGDSPTGDRFSTLNNNARKPYNLGG